jgi:hypothetical protein
VTEPFSSKDRQNGRGDAYENAAAAMDAYADKAFPGHPIAHRDNPVIGDAWLRGLLSDLLHYADRNKIDFREAFAAARQIHADEVADGQVHPPGPVQPHDTGVSEVDGQVEVAFNDFPYDITDGIPPMNTGPYMTSRPFLQTPGQEQRASRP